MTESCTHVEVCTQLVFAEMHPSPEAGYAFGALPVQFTGEMLLLTRGAAHPQQVPHTPAWPDLERNRQRRNRCGGREETHMLWNRPFGAP